MSDNGNGNAVSIEANRASNIVSVRYRGHVNVESMERSIDAMRAALEQLTPGFRLLADLSKLEAMDAACVPYIDQVMQLCADRGVSAIARIIPDPRRDIGMSIMSRFHYGRQVAIMTCATEEEAMRALA